MMVTQWLRLKAPFAAFRHFQAGVYRSSYPIIPYSAAWGLVLNLAGVEIRTRQDSAITEIDPDAPSMQLAIGAINHAERGCLYQQLHSYPVGNSGKDMAPRTKGSKYWIAPVKREILIGLDVMIGVRADNGLLGRMAKGLSGELEVDRYGLPFAGDNNLLFDEIQLLDRPIAAYWFTPVAAESRAAPGSSRLTVGIDRSDSSQTSSQLAAPAAEKSVVPPDSAWLWTPKAPS